MQLIKSHAVETHVPVHMNVLSLEERENHHLSFSFSLAIHHAGSRRSIDTTGCQHEIAKR